jgi:hypothetical protein
MDGAFGSFSCSGRCIVDFFRATCLTNDCQYNYISIITLWKFGSIMIVLNCRNHSGWYAKVGKVSFTYRLAVKVACCVQYQPQQKGKIPWHSR